MEILFEAGHRQVQPDNSKKIAMIAGLPKPKNYWHCLTRK